VVVSQSAKSHRYSPAVASYTGLASMRRPAISTVATDPCCFRAWARQPRGGSLGLAGHVLRRGFAHDYTAQKVVRFQFSSAPTARVRYAS
jgi:hypothetical protein